MTTDGAKPEQERAKAPHEVFMFNLIAFHLLLTPAVIALGIGAWGLLLPPGLSLLVIGYIYLRARRTAKGEPPLVAGHWQVAWRRCRLLLLAYGASALLLLGAWGLAHAYQDPSMQEIMFTVLTRVAVMPVVVMVFVLAVLESGAIYQAGRGEVPGRPSAQSDDST
ncbi:MAG TPA: hypothetical protein VKA64_08125 [Gammaproteobacteria bacterium]|nr:hypothetical protein [Gammaproteobacteria bacterium]